MGIDRNEAARHRREEQEVPRADGADGPAGRAARVLHTVSLVDDEQIPLRRRERLPERWPPCGGEGGDEHRWVASRCIVGDAGGREDFGRKGELALQLLAPLLDEARWDEDQDPPRDATQAQLRQDEAGLDGLAEADLVGEQPAHRHAGGGALGDVQLVREQPHASAEERTR